LKVIKNNLKIVSILITIALSLADLEIITTNKISHMKSLRTGRLGFASPHELAAASMAGKPDLESHRPNGQFRSIMIKAAQLLDPKSVSVSPAMTIKQSKVHACLPSASRFARRV